MVLAPGLSVGPHELTAVSPAITPRHSINRRTPMSNTPFLQEVSRRRTFAIISHPDAGKTTITEKVLLFGQAIQTAGTVKGRGSSQHAKSEIGRASCRERV